MSNPQTSGHSTLLRLVVIALLAVGAAVAANRYLMPPAAHYVFAQPPPVDLGKLERQRSELARHVVLSMMAGVIGPSDAGPKVPPEGASPEPATSQDGDEQPSDGAKTTESGEDKPRKPTRRHVSTSDPEPREERDDAPRPSKTREAPPEDPVPPETTAFTIRRPEINRRLRRPGTVSRKIAVVSERNGSGKPTGLRVQRLDGFYSQFGLRPGDVVLAVNGRNVTTRQNAIEHVANMRDRTSFVVDVRRNGETFQFTYRVPKHRKKRQNRQRK